MKKPKKTFYNTHERTEFSLKNILVLPYHKEFVPLIEFLKPFKINVLFRNVSSIKMNLIKNSPESKNKGGIYVIDCNRCTKKYIGQTGKELKKRLYQHKYCVWTAVESSAIFLHARDFNHNMNWDSSKFVYNSSSVTERLLIETCLIKNQNTLNISDGLFKIDPLLTSFILNDPKCKQALRHLNNNWIVHNILTVHLVFDVWPSFCTF